MILDFQGKKVMARIYTDAVVFIDRGTVLECVTFDGCVVNATEIPLDAVEWDSVLFDNCKIDFFTHVKRD